MLGLTERAAKSLTDPRRKASCRHSLSTMVRQRVYALVLGYEDLNDHDELRSDPAPGAANGGGRRRTAGRRFHPVDAR